jgi:hypothetical protein
VAAHGPSSSSSSSCSKGRTYATVKPRKDIPPGTKQHEVSSRQGASAAAWSISLTTLMGMGS